MNDFPLKAATRRHIEDLTERCPAWRGAESQVENAVQLLCDCHKNGGRILVCGNGGSAADSEHIVAELVKSFALCRTLPAADADKLRALQNPDADLLREHLQPGVAAISLCSQAALSTAISNDTQAHLSFAQQTYVYGKSGDILIALSTSGNSRNVLLALQTARAFGLSTIGLSGKSGGDMAPCCDLLFRAPSHETFRIQEFHLPLYHTICAMVEAELFGD